MPASDSMVVAAIAMPNRPATMKVTMMPTQITITGSAVASIEMARPWITLVPWPVVELCAIERTGRYSVEV